MYYDILYDEWRCRSQFGFKLLDASQLNQQYNTSSRTRSHFKFQLKYEIACKGYAKINNNHMQTANAYIMRRRSSRGKTTVAIRDCVNVWTKILHGSRSRRALLHDCGWNLFTANSKVASHGLCHFCICFGRAVDECSQFSRTRRKLSLEKVDLRRRNVILNGFVRAE